MTQPDPAVRPAARALDSQCPPHLWPQVQAFLRVETYNAPADRFRAALELCRDAGSEDERVVWALVADYLEELHHVG